MFKKFVIVPKYRTIMDLFVALLLFLYNVSKYNSDSDNYLLKSFISKSLQFHNLKLSTHSF